MCCTKLVYNISLVFKSVVATFPSAKILMYNIILIIKEHFYSPVYQLKINLERLFQ